MALLAYEIISDQGRQFSQQENFFVSLFDPIVPKTQIFSNLSERNAVIEFTSKRHAGRNLEQSVARYGVTSRD
jgi:hypothetical protein